MEYSASMADRQKGAVLIVSLILMLVLTILAVATMSAANLEVEMAANNQNSENAFQMAETGLKVNVNTLDNNRSLLVAVAGSLPVCTGTITISGVGDYQACSTFSNEVTPLLGASAGIGTGLAAYHFDSISTGQSFDSARSTHIQSFYVPGPGGGN